MAYGETPSRPNNGDFWEFLEKNRKEVETWPTWRKGEPTAIPDESGFSCSGRGDRKEEPAEK